jgi:LacI family transcriptional regulator
MGKGRVTVIDIAKAAGVSKSTVSLVLQASPLVNETTRTKVNAVMRELGYVYNRGAANLRQANAQSKIIGIVVNDLTNSFFAELAVGVDTVVQSAGFVQFLSNTSESIDRQREVIASMREHGVSGLIVSPARGTETIDMKPLVAAGIPVVLVVRSVPGAKVSSLVSDNHAGTRAAVEHLGGAGASSHCLRWRLSRHRRFRRAPRRIPRGDVEDECGISGRSGRVVGTIPGRGRGRLHARNDDGRTTDGSCLLQ